MRYLSKTALSSSPAKKAQNTRFRSQASSRTQLLMCSKAVVLLNSGKNVCVLLWRRLHNIRFLIRYPVALLTFQQFRNELSILGKIIGRSGLDFGDFFPVISIFKNRFFKANSAVREETAFVEKLPLCRCPNHKAHGPTNMKEHV